MDKTIFKNYLIKFGFVCLATNCLVAIFPQASSAQPKKECDRIYNLDTSTWANENQSSYESNRQSCYNKATQQISSVDTNYSIRERNLRRAMLRVENNYYKRNGAFIQINRNNVTEMMQNIGATPVERQFVIQQMSFYL